MRADIAKLQGGMEANTRILLGIFACVFVFTVKAVFFGI